MLIKVYLVFEEISRQTHIVYRSPRKLFYLAKTVQYEYAVKTRRARL